MSKRFVKSFVCTLIASGILRIAQAQSALPPARSYHTDQYGRESKVVKERYQEDSQGEKHGLYLLYNSKGQLITKYTYSHGVKSGPAFLIREDEFYSISFRPMMKFVGSFLKGKEDGWWNVYQVGVNGEKGAVDRDMLYANGNLNYVVTYSDGNLRNFYTYANGDKNGEARLYGASKQEYASGKYRNGQRVGTWQNAGVKVEGGNTMLIYRKGGRVTFDNGVLRSVTDPNGMTRTLAEMEQQRAAAATIVKEQQALREEQENNFYNYSEPTQELFKRTSFTLATGGQATGSQLVANKVFQVADFPALVVANADRSPAVGLLLKQAKASGLDPIRLLVRYAALPRAGYLALIDQRNPLLDAEMLYYGMRGVEEEKGHGSALWIQQLIRARSIESQNYKQLVERFFDNTSKAAKDAYSDTKKYPLRRWIYEEYSPTDSDPLKWMNMVTKSDPQNDQVNFPKLYNR